jgi:translation initiation factor eIF-2B subunit epsilon
LKLCYDHDIVSEEAILDWAGEKEHASLEDRHFVDQCSALLTWLQEASEEDSSDEDG